MALNRESVIAVRPLAEIEFLEGAVELVLWEHGRLRLHGRGRELLRLLGDGVLVFAETVALAPRHFVRDEQLQEVFRVNVEPGILPHDAHERSRVLVRDTEAPAFVVHEPVEGNLAERAEIALELPAVIQQMQVLGAFTSMHLVWNAGRAAMENTILLVAPFQRGAVQVCHVVERAPGKEVLLHKAHQAFHLSLGERMPRLAELRLEADGVHEGVIV